MARTKIVAKKSARKMIENLKLNGHKFDLSNSITHRIFLDNFYFLDTLDRAYDPPTQKKKSKSIKTKSFGRKEKKALKSLQNKMRHDAMVEKCKGFMYEKAKNIVLMPSPSFNYAIVRGRLMKPSLDSPVPSYVLINSGLNTYRKIAYPVYKKLCKIQYMTLRIKMTMLEDGAEEYYDAFDKEYRISSLNQLFDILSRREGMLEASQVFHAGQGWYTTVNTRETVKILYKNNTVEVTTLDKFLKNHKIYD